MFHVRFLFLSVYILCHAVPALSAPSSFKKQQLLLDHITRITLRAEHYYKGIHNPNPEQLILKNLTPTTRSEPELDSVFVTLNHHTYDISMRSYDRLEYYIKDKKYLNSNDFKEIFLLSPAPNLKTLNLKFNSQEFKLVDHFFYTIILAQAANILSHDLSDFENGLTRIKIRSKAGSITIPLHPEYIQKMKRAHAMQNWLMGIQLNSPTPALTEQLNLARSITFLPATSAIDLRLNDRYDPVFKIWVDHQMDLFFKKNPYTTEHQALIFIQDTFYKTTLFITEILHQLLRQPLIQENPTFLIAVSDLQYSFSKQLLEGIQTLKTRLTPQDSQLTTEDCTKELQKLFYLVEGETFLEGTRIRSQIILLSKKPREYETDHIKTPIRNLKKLLSGHDPSLSRWANHFSAAYPLYFQKLWLHNMILLRLAQATQSNSGELSSSLVKDIIPSITTELKTLAATSSQVLELQPLIEKLQNLNQKNISSALTKQEWTQQLLEIFKISTESELSFPILESISSPSVSTSLVSVPTAQENLTAPKKKPKKKKSRTTPASSQNFQAQFTTAEESSDHEEAAVIASAISTLQPTSTLALEENSPSRDTRTTTSTSTRSSATTSPTIPLAMTEAQQLPQLPIFNEHPTQMSHLDLLLEEFHQIVSHIQNDPKLLMSKQDHWKTLTHAIESENFRTSNFYVRYIEDQAILIQIQKLAELAQTTATQMLSQMEHSAIPDLKYTDFFATSIDRMTHQVYRESYALADHAWLEYWKTRAQDPYTFLSRAKSALGPEWMHPVTLLLRDSVPLGFNSIQQYKTFSSSMMQAFDKSNQSLLDLLIHRKRQDSIYYPLAINIFENYFQQFSEQFFPPQTLTAHFTSGYLFSIYGSSAYLQSFRNFKFYRPDNISNTPKSDLDTLLYSNTLALTLYTFCPDTFGPKKLMNNPYLLDFTVMMNAIPYKISEALNPISEELNRWTAILNRPISLSIFFDNRNQYVDSNGRPLPDAKFYRYVHGPNSDAEHGTDFLIRKQLPFTRHHVTLPITFDQD